MLFIESKTAELNVEKSLRTPVLEALQERGLVPLIRASRLHFFEQALSGAERARDLERAVAEWSDAEGDVPYVRGDVFCSDDHAHFLLFGDADDGSATRAGIVYDAETSDPAGKLEAFCRDVQEAVESASRGAPGRQSQGFLNVEWRQREGRAQEVFRGFAGEGGEPASPAPRGGIAGERARAVEIL